VDDLRGCSFEHFLTYAFERPPPRSRDDQRWWDDEAVDEVHLLVDPELQIEHATALFRDPLVVHARFTPGQVDQGFWFLAFGHATDYGAFFVDALWGDDAEAEVRCRCVAAMFDLYEKLFSPFPTETATYMWWDLIASFVLERRADGEVAPKLASQERVRKEMVCTLTRILALDARHCQEAALHGLNHIATASERTPVIEQFMRIRQPDEKLRKYALQCISGHAQ